MLFTISQRDEKTILAKNSLWKKIGKYGANKWSLMTSNSPKRHKLHPQSTIDRNDYNLECF